MEDAILSKCLYLVFHIFLKNTNLKSKNAEKMSMENVNGHNATFLAPTKIRFSMQGFLNAPTDFHSPETQK